MSKDRNDPLKPNGSARGAQQEWPYHERRQGERRKVETGSTALQVERRQAERRQAERRQADSVKPPLKASGYTPGVSADRRKGERRQGDRRQSDATSRNRRTHERRWDNARFYLIERRKGNAWKYGSISLAIMLMTTAGVLLK